ncbi:class II fructose-bisphosphate aldolase [Clostridium botulinum]|uniref:class II fructose-bisphosphate aldolase n=1 Tax=Clostridium botulinum TaxID=1491 RepID=UPI001C9B60B3|nr:class II fructose-bisphosphate aldolase [Clostridium botulinum]MBY6809051.1 class II aldolase [Clostridium botulinum]MBY6822244.1 class II aldolase [Clostridium botulinum]MBY6832966.1 class II aldolase [Clostridium botulinum]MBY6972194.1 class II aldolase [Clostridium botulinum]
MPLVNMNELLLKADNENYAVGSFSVANMEMIIGAIKAAEELNSPIILQIAEVRLKHSPLDIIGPSMIKAAEKSKVPVAIHFDHGLTIENIKKALSLGFTSVMIDGSSLDFLENIKITSLVEKLARDYGAAVEGEIGHVGGSEDGSEEGNIKVTDLEEARQFINDTEIDALAVAIGNSHGVYKGEPKLRFDILTKLHDNLKIPLVLHGGSGISEDDFKKCATMGIRKINIATATFNKVRDSVKNLNSNSKDYDYFTLHETEIQGAYENVEKHIKIFGSENKAGL